MSLFYSFSFSFHLFFACDRSRCHFSCHFNSTLIHMYTFAESSHSLFFFVVVVFVARHSLCVYFIYRYIGYIFAFSLYLPFSLRVFSACCECDDDDDSFTAQQYRMAIQLLLPLLQTHEHNQYVVVNNCCYCCCLFLLLPSFILGLFSFALLKLCWYLRFESIGMSVTEPTTQ